MVHAAHANTLLLVPHVEYVRLATLATLHTTHLRFRSPAVVHARATIVGTYQKVFAMLQLATASATVHPTVHRAVVVDTASFARLWMVCRL